jgi:hypothetical protein
VSLALLPAPWAPRLRPELDEQGGVVWTGEIETGIGLWTTYRDDGPQGTLPRTLVAVEALCSLRDHLEDLCRLARVGLAPERACVARRIVRRPGRYAYDRDDPRPVCGSLWRAYDWPPSRPQPRFAAEVDPEDVAAARRARLARDEEARYRPRGRGARGVRLHRGHRFRESTVELFADAPRSATSPLLAELRRIRLALAPLPPGWEMDIDDWRRDSRGKLVSGHWTGKVYTGRRGSWCWYNARESGVVYAPIVEALCALRNVIGEALAAARAGAAVERELLAGAASRGEHATRAKKGPRGSARGGRAHHAACVTWSWPCPGCASAVHRNEQRVRQQDDEQRVHEQDRAKPRKRPRAYQPLSYGDPCGACHRAGWRSR